MGEIKEVLQKKPENSENSWFLYLKFSDFALSRRAETGMKTGKGFKVILRKHLFPLAVTIPSLAGEGIREAPSALCQKGA